MFELGDEYMEGGVITLVSLLVDMFEFFDNKRQKNKGIGRKKLFGDMPTFRYLCDKQLGTHLKLKRLVQATQINWRP